VIRYFWVLISSLMGKKASMMMSKVSLLKVFKLTLI
jgi:hypothetical protein